MGSNDMVSLMALDLADLCNLKIVNTDIYSSGGSLWTRNDYTHSTTNPIRWLDETRLLTLVKEEDPDFVVVNSGGTSITKATLNMMRKRGIVTVGISLSDPDVFPEHGKWYSESYDLFYTNSLYALGNMYVGRSNSRLLPFAASTRLHRPMPAVERAYDVVVVGHARPDRIRVVRRLEKHFAVGLYGRGWHRQSKEVHGDDHVRALNSGRLYLSFPQTFAHHVNVKVGVFEAVACRSCVITQEFEEMEMFFKFGVDLIGYRSLDKLPSLIRDCLRDDRYREWVAERGYRRFLGEHTWAKRWQVVLNDICSCRSNLHDYLKV